MSLPDAVVLFEKIIKARVKLEAMKRTCTDGCPTNDPHMAGACRCGAIAHNAAVNAVLAELKI